MSNDPSSYLPAANAGKPPLIKLQNIGARPELNGQFGQAISFSSERYVVALLDPTTAAAMQFGNNGTAAATPTFLRLKPENLTRAGNLDQLKFGALTAFASAKKFLQEPKFQEYSRRVMSYLPLSVQQKVSPEQAMLGAVLMVQAVAFLFWLLLARVFGFSKLITVFCLLGMMLAVSSPDWMDAIKEGKPIGLVAKRAAANFPGRWRDNLAQMTGYTGLSERMAKASLIVLLLWSGKILLTPSYPAGLEAPRPQSSASSGNDSDIPLARQPIPARPRYDLEYIYKLGFDDATSGKEFGSSLPADIKAYNEYNDASVYQQADDTDPNFDWSYNPPPVHSPPPKKRSNLGMGAMLSLFALFRFGRDLVTTPDGRLQFDTSYIVQKLRATEQWRLGLLGFSLYNVVKSFASLLRS